MHHQEYTWNFNFFVKKDRMICIGTVCQGLKPVLWKKLNKTNLVRLSLKIKTARNIYHQLILAQQDKSIMPRLKFLERRDTHTLAVSCGHKRMGRFGSKAYTYRIHTYSMQVHTVDTEMCEQYKHSCIPHESLNPFSNLFISLPNSILNVCTVGTVYIYIYTV